MSKGTKANARHGRLQLTQESNKLQIQWQCQN